DEDTIVKVLVERVEKHYLNPGRLESLERTLLARAEAKHDGAPAEAERLRGRLDKLGAGIGRSRSRWLQAADSVTFAELSEAQREGGLGERAQQRERLGKELAAAEARQPAPAEQDQDKVRAAIARLRELGEMLRNARGRRLGEVIAMIVSRADLYFEEKYTGK